MDIIYKIISPNGKIYIGRTDNFKRRMIEHKNVSKTSKYAIYKAIRKYGWENFKKEVICEVPPYVAQKIEEEFILAYNSVRTGYNDTYKGTGRNVWKWRRDSIEYMEFIKKMKKTNQSNRMHGKKHSEKSKQLQKEKAKGRFSLPWFIERNGEKLGTKKYNERCTKLRNRVLIKDNKGRFVKKST